MSDIRRMPAESQRVLIDAFTNFIQEMHDNQDVDLSLSEIVSGLGHCSIDFLKTLAGSEKTIEWLEMQLILMNAKANNISTTLQ